MSAGFAGLTKDKYEDLLKNCGICFEDYIAYYGLGLDSLSVVPDNGWQSLPMLYNVPIWRKKFLP